MAAPVEETFSGSLTKVRRLTGSNLSHQSKPAQLLVAIESALATTLKVSTLPYTSTAYFTSLLQCLEKACADDIVEGEDEDAIAETENMAQGALIPAALYLLAIVIPEAPPQVVLSRLSPLLECILPLFDSALEHPPALRSLLQITTSLLLISPVSTLNSSPLLKRSWAYLLEFNLDPRPKVRHVAQEGVRKVLCTPIPPKLSPGAHPYLPKARDWVVGHLREEVQSGGTSSGNKGKKARFADAEEADGKKAIWIVQGLRGWVVVWGDEHLSELCSLLLSLPPLAHLTSQIYSLLAHLLSPPPADTSSAKPAVLANLPTIIDSLLSSPPDIKSNSSDLPTYLTALTSALIKLSLQDPMSLPSYLPKTFTLLFTNILLSASAPHVLTAASEAIGSQGLIRYCLIDEMILASVNYSRQGSLEAGARKKQKTPFVTRIISTLTDAIDTNALKLPFLLPILSALVSRLRLRVTEGVAQVDPTGEGKTAAEELLLSLIQDVGDLRMQKGFESVAKVDDVVGMAIEVIGVEGVLKALPLNIEADANGNTPRPGRAHLLPLIRSRVTNDSLAYFTEYFRPLSERLFGRKVAAEEAGKDSEAKVWEVLVGQIWDCFPGFCEMPRDMKKGLTSPFLTLITNLLYTQPLLLPSLLRALSQLVSSTRTLLSSASPPQELRKQFGLDQETAKENLAHLETIAKDMVSVLLNVFSKLPREQRGMVGDVIGAWVGIMTETDVVNVYSTVTTHLSSNLHDLKPPSPGASPISHTMLDLLIIFVPYLPATQSTQLFSATANPILLEHKDATVQKKSYRLLKRLLEAGKLGDMARGDQLQTFVEKLGEVGGGVGPGAQRDRLQLLTALVEALPKDRLNLIPELLSEAVLGTKEVNEKARDAGFDLLVTMGHKMTQGGEVKQVANDDEEMAEGSVEASAEEYLTMVAAGLTGTTPHMISASINALSRLVFEFRASVSDETLSELISTVAVFVASKNREIVKSALGFVKVAVVALPASTMQPHLPILVPALLGWVHDHKNHFKSKTIHIFERTIRKFGFDEVYKHAPAEGGERKVLDGIRKRKERAKRKKAKAEDGDEEEERPAQKSSSGNAFDDILYNSDSDLSDNDDDETSKGRPIKPLGKKGKKDTNASYIRHEGDEPMDLLSRSIAGGVTSSDPRNSQKRKPGQEAAHFKTDKSGKLIIPADSDSEGQDEVDVEARLAASAFNAATRGVDGATRDARGNLRFNKNTKRTREDEREFGVDIDEPEKKVGKKKREIGRLGEEFRAKRAGGDIKRHGGMDPYSYVSLGQAAGRKKGQQTRVSLTNKKKGSRA
ncbi:NUC173 domain-domain-containing protein [Naematelia encephala]|uniref:NUC173 domain-domain-containing protein n=1 Tax=Naematelia encephala TaxID=71784 RepID=A0A1Y2BA94_9TREE|nr:NUC173 domain-domain-containing protein [Naematelia encephala]